MMPKVLRLITRMNIGGPARQALLLTGSLNHRFPTTLGAGSAPPSEGELADPNVQVRRLPLVRPLRPHLDARAVIEARRLIADHDLLHTHMAKAGAVGRAAARLSSPRPRTVHTFHGHVLDEYFSRPVQTAFIALERRLAAMTDVLIAISPEVRDSLLSKGIGSPHNFRVIPLGFELGSFLAVGEARGRFRAEFGIFPNDPLIASIGRLAPIKDHQTLLLAMCRLPEVHLAIVGDGELRERLQQQIADLRLSGRIHFTGWRLDIADLLADVDAVVLTSRNEGTPVSLIEALAAGRPVVATDVGGVPYVVKDGETGYICPPGDPESFAGAVERLLSNPREAAQMGMRGRKDVRVRFSAERLVRDIADLYEELLGLS